MARKTPGSGAEGQLRLPTLGGLLRELRDSRRISREKLAFAAGVSASYITHLENGDRDRPTRPVLAALIEYLDRISTLGDDERRHLLELAGLDHAELPEPATLRAAITRDMHRTLAMQEPNLAAYLDIRWNLLACNDAYRAAFPGVEAAGNVLRWLFADPVARRVVLEWEDEAMLAVQSLRAAIGRYAESEWAVGFLAELAEFPEFRRLWERGGASYGRERLAMYLRDPRTGVPRHIAVQTFRLDAGPYPGFVQYYLGMRVS